jgi:hypothetical protein
MKNEPKIELSLDAIKEVYKEQEQNIKEIIDYELPSILEDVANPLTFGEKKKLKKHKIIEIDSLKEESLDDLLVDLLTLRNISDDQIDKIPYSDLQMWVRKVAITTFNTKVIATKK